MELFKKNTSVGTRLWTLTKYPGHRERGQNACRGRFIVPTADLSAPGKPYSMSVVICQFALSRPPDLSRDLELLERIEWIKSNGITSTSMENLKRPG